ncbi:MAG: hypothetical protein M1828_002859 [Chrysothrix sp. TS-e1954]|nr:MAG: hypothetical protein M1828_002859 [Chrysothrix sp. TS-e1954]
MLISAQGMSLPGFKPTELLKLIKALCTTDGPKWLPADDTGKFLYIRPTLIGTEAGLGLRKPRKALLFIIIACFPEAEETPKGLSLLANEADMARSWPGGPGSLKTGANYGPILMAQEYAKSRGSSQMLWLVDRGNNQQELTELGSSNIFVVWRTPEGVLEILTPTLEGRLILAGITRRSVLEIVHQRVHERHPVVEGLKIVERRVYMHELVEASDQGRLLEAFTCGTAVFIAPISTINYRGKEYNIPTAEGSMRPFAQHVKSWLRNIFLGDEHHDWGHIVDG